MTQVGAGQVRRDQVGAAKVRGPQVRTHQRRTHQVGVPTPGRASPHSRTDGRADVTQDRPDAAAVLTDVQVQQLLRPQPGRGAGVLEQCRHAPGHLGTQAAGGHQDLDLDQVCRSISCSCLTTGNTSNTSRASSGDFRQVRPP